MRFDLLVVSVMTLAAAGTYWYRSTENICPVPLTYHVGEIAPEFNLSKEQVEAYLRDAEVVWEQAAGRELFQSTEAGSLAVNFLFDERQALAESQLSQKSALDGERDKTEELLDTIDEERKKYEAEDKEYQEKMAAYERKLTAYNEKVNRYNDQGGAPSEVYAELEREKATLNRESSGLNATADKLNELARTINELNDKSSQFIDEYNKQVLVYNEEFGFSREFTQGDYQDDVINIYKFSTENELRTVLAHEFGHALGVDHVEGRSSVMYYLLENTSSFPTLSPEDTAAFATTCGDGSSLEARVRAEIRAVLVSF